MNALPPRGLRPVIYAVKGRHVTTYKVEAKGADFRKVLGTLDTFAEAMAAFDTYTATGELPPRRKRGPKGPHGVQNGDRVKPARRRHLAEHKAPKAADSSSVQKAPNRVALLREALQRRIAKENAR